MFNSATYINLQINLNVVTIGSLIGWGITAGSMKLNTLHCGKHYLMQCDYLYTAHFVKSSRWYSRQMCFMHCSFLPTSRWHQSSKSSTLTNKETPTGPKADALREEMEEAANRMEICRVGGASLSLYYLMHTAPYS